MAIGPLDRGVEPNVGMADYLAVLVRLDSGRGKRSADEQHFDSVVNWLVCLSSPQEELLHAVDLAGGVGASGCDEGLGDDEPTKEPIAQVR